MGARALPEPRVTDRDLHRFAAAATGLPAQIEVHRQPAGGSPLRPRAVLQQLWSHYHARAVLCEGGPQLNASLLADRVLDELLLTLSPQLASGPLSAIVGEGAELPTTVALELLHLYEHRSFLFLRYGLRYAAAARGELTSPE